MRNLRRGAAAGALLALGVMGVMGAAGTFAVSAVKAAGWGGKAANYAAEVHAGPVAFRPCTARDAKGVRQLTCASVTLTVTGPHRIREIWGRVAATDATGARTFDSSPRELLFSSTGEAGEKPKPPGKPLTRGAAHTYTRMLGSGITQGRKTTAVSVTVTEAYEQNTPLRGHTR